jgi:hypothetical protein
MPWARIPPDRLVDLPLFGIDVLHEDEDFVWMTGGPNGGRQSIRKVAPRVWFDDAADAHQAGATAIMISGTESTSDPQVASEPNSEQRNDAA